MYLEGKSYQQISNTLNKEKVLAPKHWRDTTIMKMFCNVSISWSSFSVFVSFLSASIGKKYFLTAISYSTSLVVLCGTRHNIKKRKIKEVIQEIEFIYFFKN